MSLAPAPQPSSDAARKRMVSQARRDTRPELQLRRALHRRGLRYRLHLRPLPSVRRTVDLVFASARTAVEIRGCFWHACPQHGTSPKANSTWWTEKLARNRARDQETERLLLEAGWELVVVWEHEDAEEAADRVAAVVANRLCTGRPPERESRHTDEQRSAGHGSKVGPGRT